MVKLQSFEDKELDAAASRLCHLADTKQKEITIEIVYPGSEKDFVRTYRVNNRSKLKQYTITDKGLDRITKEGLWER